MKIMKTFLKKYIGIILTSGMLILFLLSYFIQSDHPKTALTCYHIVMIYIAIYSGAIILYLEFIFLENFDKIKNKFKDWLIKKIIHKE
jgi:hypothetical protein